MSKIYSGYDTADGTKLYYEIIMNNGKEYGFNIYEGDVAETPSFHQPEPWIPDRSKSYIENAIEMCKTISEDSSVTPEPPFIMTREMYLEQQANIDYLLLLTE